MAKLLVFVDQVSELGYTAFKVFITVLELLFQFSYVLSTFLPIIK